MQRRTPFIIDVEASGLGTGSYPIEIGVALDQERYCTLIQPESSWTHWSDSAEKIHGISRDELFTYGKPVAEVARHLNELLAGKTLYTDGWVVDKPWLVTLFYAASCNMHFSVSPLEMILSEQQMSIWHPTKDQIVQEFGLVRHRASNDAWIIQATYDRTLDITAGSAHPSRSYHVV